MEIRITLLKPFSDVVGTKELTLDFSGTTIEDLLSYLVEEYPALKPEFFSEDEHVPDYLSIFVNDKPSTALQGLQTKLHPNDTLVFFIPLSGG